VTIELGDGTSIVATVAIDPSGKYLFLSVKPSNYFVLESSPDGYSSNVKDQVITPDGDVDDSNTVVDNFILVTLLVRLSQAMTSG